MDPGCDHNFWSISESKLMKKVQEGSVAMRDRPHLGLPFFRAGNILFGSHRAHVDIVIVYGASNYLPVVIHGRVLGIVQIAFNPFMQSDKVGKVVGEIFGKEGLVNVLLNGVSELSLNELTL